MHLCRLHEDGERGGGERALQSRGEGWDLEGQDAKEGCRVVKAAQLHLHILCHLGLSWLSSSGLSLRH